MKRTIVFKKHFLIGLIAASGIFSACSDKSDLGMDLLPTTDLIEIRNQVEREGISSYTYTEGPIRTDEPSRSLLGSIYDPLFGKTTIHFATQFRLQGNYDYGTNTVIDSVRLYLYYRLIYGDTVTTRKFRVYELLEPIFADSTDAKGGTYDYPYYQDIDLKSMASSQLLGEVDFKPVIRLDTLTRDTFYQRISIPLDPLGVKLVEADSMQMINNDAFLEYFNGLYIESEEQTTLGGTILTLEAAPTGNFQGSALVVFYNNNENLSKERPDTLLFNPYVISRFSARVNSIEHDYTGTPFEANLNLDSGEDSLIYVQATGGLKSRILIDGLSSWRDSANMVINKAEIVFQIDTIVSQLDKFPPPAQLLFTVVDEAGTEFLPVDYLFSPLFYGGYLRRSDYTYRFNITQQVQRIINGTSENHGFFLTTAHKNSEANRVVLKGSNSQTGIRLIITYSKFLQ